MELDSFLASPRWDILKIITNNPSAPIEISEKTNTTTSFVSQQLKLLEAAGLVKKEKTGASEKGKPRSLFSIKEESAYIIPLAKNTPDKFLIKLSKESKTIINILSLKDPSLQIFLQKFFWEIHSNLDKIEAILLYAKSNIPKIYVISKDDFLTHKINEAQKNMEKQVVLQVTASLTSLEKLDSEHLFPIYLQEIATSTDNLKGGLEQDE